MTIRASRTRFVWTPILGWVLLSCAAPAVLAQVDTVSPAKQTLEQQTPQVDLPTDASTSGGPITVGDEMGISVGAFTLYPVLELNVGYDDNVFASVPPTTPSLVSVIRPSLELRSEWARHHLRLLANGGFGFYPSAPTQNFQNYMVQVDGKLDIRTDFWLSGLVAFRRATEALGTPNVSFAQAPTVADSVPVELSLYQKFNRLFYQLTASATRYWYYDYSTITALGLPAASRDRTEYQEQIRIGYEIFDERLSVFISPGFNQRVYVETVNTAGQQRDSTGFNMGVGASLTLSPKSTLEGQIGWTTQNYTASGTSTSALYFSLSGSWNGYEPLMVRPVLSRSINESALSNYQNYVSTVAGIDFTYDIHYPWKAIGGLSYNVADYTPVPGLGANPRTDYFIKASLGLLYEVRPQYSIGPVYEYSQGTTTDVAAGGPQFTRNFFSVRLIARR
jgi:hypothetical protein